MNDDTESTSLSLPDAEVVIHPQFLAVPRRGPVVYRVARNDRLAAGQHPDVRPRDPRLTAWYRDAGTGYIYLGIATTPAP